MKLIRNNTSPFVRKVLITAHELNLLPQITQQIEAVPPFTGVTPHNPLSKVPTLLLNNDTPLYDSKVICEYLNELAGGRLIPDVKSGKRWEVLRRQALADGLAEAAVMTFVETRVRPPHLRWDATIASQWRKVTLALDRFEEEAREGGLAGPESMTVGEIALV
ncbi:hypothetical protein HK097_006862, partial [Rhizophlyctis rosea]